ncbi:hypothetical protein O6H91_07G038600 [Diphasiastrum complanatum]|uniref:Uncharacterized protein n=1 Tax=Diphasiastrum complanatum TaxID=34168 RepID=A0ACC2D4J4_DIPCM|nr:hypothetical protein O6H91_07G038600 [Diphasiastrum complanatum]
MRCGHAQPSVFCNGDGGVTVDVDMAAEAAGVPSILPECLLLCLGSSQRLLLAPLLAVPDVEMGCCHLPCVGGLLPCSTALRHLLCGPHCLFLLLLRSAPWELLPRYAGLAPAAVLSISVASSPVCSLALHPSCLSSLLTHFFFLPCAQLLTSSFLPILMPKQFVTPLG